MYDEYMYTNSATFHHQYENPTEAESAPGAQDTRRRSDFSRRSRIKDRRKTVSSL